MPRNAFGQCTLTDVIPSLWIVFINEVDNEPAAKAVEVVLTYLKKNIRYGLSVQLDSIEANKSDAKVLLEASELWSGLCQDSVAHTHTFPSQFAISTQQVLRRNKRPI